MSIDDKARYAAAGFIALLLLSLFWPAPIVSLNRLWLHQNLGIDELSFLGREQPSWDVVFWCIAGLFAIAIAQSGDIRVGASALARSAASEALAATRFWRKTSVGAVLIALTWAFLDRPVLRLAERVQSDTIEDWIRIANRLGGGMNPAMIVLFFLIAGYVYGKRNWLSIGVAMAIAGLAAGITAQIIKMIVGRVRPELWLGPFHYMRGSANSFPSGHTVAAFALGGVLMFASRSMPMRVIAMVLACAVAIARVLAFRHWPSDVVASAILGLLYASTSAKLTDTSREQPASSIVTP